MIVEKYTYPMLIKNTAASIPGRGMHWLHHIVETDVKSVPELTVHYYQCDIHHYYDSIEQWRMKALIREYISDPVLLPILDNFIELLPEGISKGLRSFPEKALQLVLKSVCERIPKRFRLNPMTDIQVLTPMNKGTCGTAEMNTRLQELLNPGTKECIRSGERHFKQGDRVMQTSTNYDLQTFNGDQGIIERIDEKKKKFTVLFDGDRPVEYGFEDADQLTLSYAITVHKSQGCEFPAVVLPILSQHSIMLQRNLLYTAVTRAKKLLVLIGGRKAIYAAACNTRQAPRYSLLAERFQDTGKND